MTASSTVPPGRRRATIRLALICSPDAGSGLGGEELSTRLRKLGAEVETFNRERLDEASQAAVDRLVVAGGDGSVAPAAAAAAERGVPLAVLPTGTANNFARAEDLPESLDEACRVAVESDRTRALELGWAGDRPFVNVASAGLAPVAADRAQRWKKRLGPAAYTVGAVSAATGTAPVPCAVTANGREYFSGRTWQVMVASSGAFGPGVQIEDTSTKDGTLDLVVIPARRRSELLRRGWWILRGRIASQPGAVHARARTFDIEVPQGTRFNVDGEVVALGPLRFRSEPRAFRLVVP